MRLSMIGVLVLSMQLSGCATGPMTQEERDSSDRTIKALEILNAYANGTRRSPTTPLAPAQPTAFLKGSYVSGMNRICVYDQLGSQKIMTVGAADLCPLSQ